MIAAIVAAEIAFWMLLLGGLALRYLARVQRASTVALAMVPVVDLALVVLVAIVVAGGAEPDRAHAFAAIYLGITVAFGPSLIARVDSWFKHRYAGGPKYRKPPKGSRAEVRAIWREWFRVVTTAVIAGIILVGMIALGGWAVPVSLEDASTHPYWAMLLLLPIVTVVWFLAGPAFAGRGDPRLDHAGPSVDSPASAELSTATAPKKGGSE